jgi:hypothetical protein
MKKIIVASSVALATGLFSLAAYADPVTVTPSNGAAWGAQVHACVGNPDCYNGGTRGSYVSGQAQPADGPFGYAEELFTLAPLPPSNPLPD